MVGFQRTPGRPSKQWMANNLRHTYHFLTANVGANMTNGWKQLHWGRTPWRIDFHPQASFLPESVDFAVVGGGFTGLSAAAELRRMDPNRTVAVFEAESVGARSSGHTGGLVLAETACGDLPGLGDVLAGYSRVLRNLNVDGDISLPGAWELDRGSRLENSPILWSDSGQLRVAREVPGGTADPGKIVTGLARAAERHGALVFEGARVDRIDFGDPLTLHVGGKRVQVQRVLIATNSESLEMSGLSGRAEPKFTLALATEPVQENKLAAIGLASGKPFYTVDLPYLWGRLLHGNQIIFGSGLVSLDSWGDLAALNIAAGEAFNLLERLKKRVSGLHPALADVPFSNEWGGPILIAEQWRPVFARHAASDRAIVLGAYSGHGVALSVYLGAWAAEVLLGRRDLPNWSSGSASSETF
jgi:glycine/D-amino acid oxidase-like deaminating enzyme